MPERKFGISVLFVFALSFVAAAQQNNKPAAKKETQPAPSKKIVEKTSPLPADGKDPVCFMKVKKGNLLTANYNGKLYGFCSEHCKAVFLADPAEQLK